jgi:sugar phosphate permease
MKRTRYRWLTLALVIVLVVINYIDRSAVSYAIDPLTRSFGISRSQYGEISSAFSIGYMAFAFAAGPLVDRFGSRKILMTGVAVWSVATAVTPLSGSFMGLFLVRVLLGAGEGPGFPAATRTVSRWLPRGERGVALAMVGGVAVSGSLLIGGPLVTQLMAHLGWHGMFWVLAALGVAWFAAAMALLRDTPEEHPRVSEAERRHIAAGQVEQERSASGKVDWRAALTSRNLWILGFGYFAWGFMFWGFMYWLPDFLGQQYHLSITAVGLFSIAPWAAGVLGALVGGVLTDRFYARTGSTRSLFTIMGTALLLSGAALIPIFAAPSLTVAVVFISLGVGLGFITGGLWWVAAIEAVPAQPGVAAGFVDAAFALSGIVAPSVMGFIVSASHSFSSGFVVMSVLAVLGAGAMLASTRKDQAPAGTIEDVGAAHSQPT